MPKAEVAAWLRGVSAALEELRAADAPRWKGWRAVHAAALTRDCRAACTNQEWKKLAERASKELTARGRDLTAMRIRQTRIADLARHGETLPAAAKGVTFPLSKDPSWTAARTAASAGLDAGGKRALANLGAMTVATLRADLAGLVEELASDLDALAAAQFANVVRATLAQAVARFNQD